MMNKTIRMIVPDWQSGDNPVYYFGAQLLNWLAPDNPHQKELTVPITDPKVNQMPLTKENGVTAQSAIIENVKHAMMAINDEQPDKIITLGGNCMVSQAPFAYLHEKYGRDLGVLWIDAHPDISTPKIFPNEHAMVLGNLLGKGDPSLAKYVRQPFSPTSILYVGLQEPSTNEKILLSELGLDYHIETNHQVNAAKIQHWIDKNHFSKIAIHFDIDVLDRDLFFDQYFDRPGVHEYSVSSGKLHPDKAMLLLSEISKTNDLVGLTIAEYLPWSALKLKEMMHNIDIFN